MLEAGLIQASNATDVQIVCLIWALWGEALIEPLLVRDALRWCDVYF